MLLDIAGERYYSCKSHRCFRARVYELDALRCRICSLVILARQKFSRKKNRYRTLGKLLVTHYIYGRLCKHRASRLLICVLRYSLNIVSVDNAHIFYARYVKILFNIVQNSYRFDIKTFFFFYINASYHCYTLLSEHL